MVDTSKSPADSPRVDRCLSILQDDRTRQSGQLVFDDVVRAISRLRLSPEEATRVWEEVEPHVLQDSKTSDSSALAPSEEGSTFPHSQKLISDPVQAMIAAGAIERSLTAREELSLARRIRLARSLLDSGPDSRVSSIVEDARKAARRMLLANVPLVIWVARDYVHHTNCELADLVQEGTIGLVRAIEHFDPELGFRFSTYALWWVNQAIRRLISEDRVIRLPAYAKTLLSQLKRRRRRLALEFNRQPTAAELAHDLGVKQKQVQLLLAVERDAFLFSTDDSERRQRHEIEELPARGCTDPSELVGRSEEMAFALKRIQAMDPRMAHIVMSRFGLDGHEVETLKEIGRKLGLTRERVRQLERDALKEMGAFLRRSFGEE